MRIGSDVKSMCRKCGEQWHVVLALHEGRIAQVQCSECKAHHRYRPVGGGAEAAPRARATRRPAARSAPARSRAPVVEPDLSRPPRPFDTREQYRVGDRVLHATFGEGVVQEVAGAQKVRVLFPSGPKALVHGRGEG